MGEGFPSGPWLPWLGRGERPSEIGSISLFLRFWNSALALFPLYLEIRNSDWIETFTQIFFQKLAFLRPKKGINRLTRGSRGWGACPPGVVWALVSWPPQTPFHVDSSSEKSQTFQNNSLSVFIPFGFRLIWIFCET